MLKLSANELSALLSRALESICGTRRDFDEAACAITWLSQCGWNTIAQLVDDIDKLTAANYRLTPTFENFAETTLIDLSGESLFTAGAMITDSGMARLMERGQSRIVLAAPLHPEAILGYLSRYSKNHLAYVHACWTTSGTKFLARMDTAHEFADVWSCREVQNDQYSANSMMQILFSTQPPKQGHDKDSLPVLHEMVGSTTGMVRTQASTEQARRYAESLEAGISVESDQYRILGQIADAVLVPTSAASRRGAGD